MPPERCPHPGTAERRNPLEDLASDNPSAATITPPPTAVAPAWGTAREFVDRCQAWGKELKERLRDAVRNEALAQLEAMGAREIAAAAREREKAAREREKTAREREEVAREREEMARKREDVAREREDVAREREDVAREREQTAYRRWVEVIRELRAEVDQNSKRRELWFNREMELHDRIIGLTLAANS